MSDVSIEHLARPRSFIPKPLVALTVTILVVSAATALYLRVGWSRMESACVLDGERGSVHNSVSYDWSWQPLGFQCTYANGKTETSLWF